MMVGGWNRLLDMDDDGHSNWNPLLDSN
ncbi:MAG: hypothetical protein QOJ20_2142, partial [Mycobacterium sp.]|nr:hypothetical protein [Mycobacterium sp.]